MKFEVLKSKIHTVKVTEASVEYEGSITIDENIVDAAGLCEFEKVDINNASNGERITTYVLNGKRGSGEICMNGAAALKFKVGDIIHVLSYASLSSEEIKKHTPIVVYTDENNKVVNK